MKKYILNLGILSLSIVMLASCKKDDDHDHGSGTTVPDPVFTFSTLIENDTIQASEVVSMLGTITYGTEMHGYAVKIHNHTTETDLFSADYHEHGASYNVNESWTNNVTDTSEIEVSIAAAIDHTGTLVTKAYHLICLP